MSLRLSNSNMIEIMSILESSQLSRSPSSSVRSVGGQYECRQFSSAGSFARVERTQAKACCESGLLWVSCIGTWLIGHQVSDASVHCDSQNRKYDQVNCPIRPPPILNLPFLAFAGALPLFMGFFSAHSSSSLYAAIAASRS